MRPPRYRFPDEVRDAAREIAAGMVDSGEIAWTPEELEAWIAGHPAVGATLVEGGYGTHFGAEDLLPLVQAMIARMGGPAAPVSSAAEAPPRRSMTGWLIGLIVAIVAVILLVFALTSTARAQAPAAAHAPALAATAVEAG
jgi:hypothetical protein